MKAFFLFISLLLCGFLLHAADVENLRCEYMANPLGIDRTAPLLNWKIVSSVRGDLQKRYQVLVSSSREMLAKDEGKYFGKLAPRRGGLGGTPTGWVILCKRKPRMHIDLKVARY